MMKSKAPKSPSKKSNVSDISVRTVSAMEHSKQDLLQDLKNWNMELSILEPCIDKVEKASKNELVLKSQELSKEFLNAQTKMAKLNREIETVQKHSNKALVKFETKLLEPFSKGNFNNQGQTVLGEAKVNIGKIQEIFSSYKQLLDAMVEKCSNNTKRLATVEDTVHKLCLPDEVEEAAKINDKLNTRMETLCQETAKFFEKPNPEQYDPKKVGNTVLQLFDAHRKGRKLLDQIQKNLHISPPSDSEIPETKRSHSPTLTIK